MPERPDGMSLYENRYATVAPLLFRFSYFIFRSTERKTKIGYLYRFPIFVRQTKNERRFVLPIFDFRTPNGIRK